MAKVIIVSSLFKKIKKKFKQETHRIIDLLETLEQNPKKGKLIANVGGVVIKELKYKSFRFYFITDGYKVKIIDDVNLTDLLIRFVRMSNKRSQQKVINEIKQILITLGPKGFEQF